MALLIADAARRGGGLCITCAGTSGGWVARGSSCTDAARPGNLLTAVYHLMVIGLLHFLHVADFGAGAVHKPTAAGHLRRRSLMRCRVEP